MWWMWLFISSLLLTVNVHATSIGRTKPLSHISNVNHVQINTPNGLVPDHQSDKQKFSITVKIPSTRKYHHLQRRWWAVSDPNNYDRLRFADQSEALYDYLTRNSSLLEQPEPEQEYRFVLEPSGIDTDVQVWTSDSNGNLVPHPHFSSNNNNKPTSFKGMAYRKVPEYRVSDGSVKRRFKPVGWARISIHKDGNDPVIQGAWRVDDKALGVRPAIYHVDKVDPFRNSLRHDELALLDSVDTNLVVWRDVDMSNHQDQDSTYQIPDDDYEFLNKRDLEASKYVVDEDYIDGHAAIAAASGSDDDTGDSGFSSGVNLESTIGDTQGCPNQREIALVGIAADCNYIKDFNNTSEAREHIISVINTASHQYESSFNISLGLKSIFMVNDTDCPSKPDDSKLKWNYECGGSGDVMGDRLSAFSQWRGQDGRSSDGLATWSLLTKCSQGSVVGLSWLGMVCTSNPSNSGNDTYVAGTNVISKTSLDWRVIAHELGHSFGAVHDCTDDTCNQGLNKQSQCCPLSKDTCNAGGQYIMNPSSTDSQDGFSDCSQGNVCQAMNRNSVNSTCLTSNTGVHLLTKNECGNGIVEEGEDCDCGGEEGCKGNPCCDPKTCKYTSGSQCDDSNEECCQNCKYASSSVVCRASQGPCDPEERCTGNSSSCPSNKFKDDGDSCSDPDHKDMDGLTCISGHCTSRDLQCITLLANSSLQIDGQSVNVSKACDDDTSCQLACMDNSDSKTCFTTSQNFLDGTPCQGKGHCSRGRCVNGRGSNPFSDSGGGFMNPNWLDNHKGVVIGIAAGIGGIILLAVVWGFLRRLCFNKRLRGPVKPGAAAAAAAAAPPPRHAPPPPPPPAQPAMFQSNNPFAQGNYPMAGGDYPQPPPPSYDMRYSTRY